MQLSKARELREQRAKICQQAQAVLDNTALNAEERSRQFDAMMADADRLKADIDRYERLETLDAETRGSAAPPNAQPGAGSGADPKAPAEQYHKAFFNYLKNGLHPDQYGFRGINEEDRALLMKTRHTVDFEARDMGTGAGGAYPGSTTGFFVPVGFVNNVEEAMLYYGDMLNVAEILTTATGNPLPYPTDNDTSIEGELVGEGGAVTTDDLSLGQIVFGACKFSTKLVKCSIELLQDSAFDLEAFLTKKFSMRLGRVLNRKFTVGEGPTHQAGSPPVIIPEPTGIITAATASGQTVIGDDNATSPDPTCQVGYIDLVTLEHSVDVAYRRTAKFMLHDQTLRFVRTLKDKYGRPLWTPGIALKAPDMIDGYPYSINNNMDQLASGKKTIAFGSLEKYLIRRVKDLTVLRLSERFADYGQIGFLGFARYDGNLLDAGTHPVKYLTQR